MPRNTPPVLAPGILSAHEQPSLEGDGVLLRPWEPADAPIVFAAYQDPDIQKWHTRGMVDLDEAMAWIDQVRQAWENEQMAGWAVETNGFISGRVVLRFIDLHDGIAEVGYWVLPAARGAGVATVRSRCSAPGRSAYSACTASNSSTRCATRSRAASPSGPGSNPRLRAGPPCGTTTGGTTCTCTPASHPADGQSTSQDQSAPSASVAQRPASHSPHTASPPNSSRQDHSGRV